MATLWRNSKVFRALKALKKVAAFLNTKMLHLLKSILLFILVKVGNPLL